jgi:hypothetical protein
MPRTLWHFKHAVGQMKSGLAVMLVTSLDRCPLSLVILSLSCHNELFLNIPSDYPWISAAKVGKKSNIHKFLVEKKTRRQPFLTVTVEQNN